MVKYPRRFGIFSHFGKILDLTMAGRDGVGERSEEGLGYEGSVYAMLRKPEGVEGHTTLLLLF